MAHTTTTLPRELPATQVDATTFESLPADIHREIAAKLDLLERDDRRWSKLAEVSRSFAVVYRDPCRLRDRQQFERGLRGAMRKGSKADLDKLMSGAWASRMATHLKCLCLGRLCIGNMLGALTGLQGLTYLDLRSANQAADSLPYLRAFTALRRLDFGWMHAQADGYRHIAATDSLEALDLSWSEIPATGLKHLTGLSALTYLDLSHATVDAYDWGALARMPHLARLDLYHCNVPLQPLAHLEACTYLHWGGCNATAADAYVLSKMPKLTHLFVESLQEVNWHDLAVLTHLRALKLDAFGLGATAVNFLTSLSQLESLDVSNSHSVNDACMPVFGQLTQLKDLDLSWTDTTGKQLSMLSGLTKLTALATNRMDDASMAHLRPFGKLEWLSLIHTDSLSAQALGQLSHLTCLRNLGLTCVTIGDAGLEMLAKLTSLRTIEMTRTGCTDAGLRMLTSLTRLEKLGKMEGNISESTWALLQQAAPRLQHW